MKKQVDWNAVDAEFEEYLKKEKVVNEQIREERKKVLNNEQLISQTKQVNDFIEKNSLNVKILTKNKKSEV